MLYISTLAASLPGSSSELRATGKPTASADLVSCTAGSSFDPFMGAERSMSDIAEESESDLVDPGECARLSEEPYLMLRTCAP